MKYIDQIQTCFEKLSRIREERQLHRQVSARRRLARRVMGVESLERRFALSCTYNDSLKTVFSTGGDVVEFHFNSPSPIVDIYCNGQGYIAFVNANDFFFVDNTSTSLVRVIDHVTSGPNLYSIVGSGTSGIAGRVNLESRNKSVMYQGANRVWLIAGGGDTYAGIYPVNRDLDNSRFPQVSVYGGSGQTRITIDDSGFAAGEYYRLSDTKLYAGRTGDKVFFPNGTVANPTLVSLLTGNGNDQVEVRGDNRRLSSMASTLNQLIMNGGTDTLRLVDDNTTVGVPHIYEFSEYRATVNGTVKVLYDYANLENIILQPGAGNDHVIIRDRFDSVLFVPPITIAFAYGGIDQITAFNSGFGLNTNYELTNNHLSLDGYQRISFFGIDTSSFQFNLISGNGDDTVTLADPSNNIQNIPVFNWQSVGGGFNLLSVNDSGFSASTYYYLHDNRLAISNDSRNLGARVYFQVSPLNSPLLQVNVVSGTGDNVYVMSSSQTTFNALPHFGVFDAGGNDVMVVDDSLGVGPLRNYTFNEYGGGLTTQPNRFFYNQSIEQVQVLLNNSVTNSVRLQATTGTIDALPNFQFVGRVDELSVYDALRTGLRNYFITESYIAERSIPPNFPERRFVQYSSAGSVGITAGSGNNAFIVRNSQSNLSGLPVVYAAGGGGSDSVEFYDSTNPNASQFAIEEIDDFSFSATLFYRGSNQALFGSVESDIENVSLYGGNGDDTIRLSFVGSLSAGGQTDKDVAVSSIAGRTYGLGGGGGENRLVVDAFSSSSLSPSVIRSNGSNSGNVTKADLSSIAFVQMGTLDYYQPAGGSLDLTQYNPADYRLRNGDLTLPSSSVAENSPIGTNVGTIQTTDPENRNNVVFSLVAGPGDTDNGFFNVVAGVLTTNAVFDFETKNQYSVRVRSVDSIGLTTEAIFIVSVANVSEPVVTGVYASGSTWNASFIDAVDGGGIGAGNGLGYLLTSGMSLANTGIDRIYIQFSEPLVAPVFEFNTSNVKLLGVNVPDYSQNASMAVLYDQSVMRGVIVLPEAITNDKLRVGIANSVAIGGLDFRFNILVGDANNDGSVNGGDLPSFSTSFNTSTGNALYNLRADWNSDGSVNGGDLPLFASNFNRSLPTSEPGPLNFPPTFTSNSVSVPMVDFEFEEVDRIFSELETDWAAVDEDLAAQHVDEFIG